MVGLRRYREDALAEVIGMRFLGTVAAEYRASGKMLEKYDVEQRKPGGGGEYPTQDGFGWTNGVTAALIGLYGDPTAPPRIADTCAMRSASPGSSGVTGSRRRQLGCSSIVPGKLGASSSPSRSSIGSTARSQGARATNVTAASATG